MDTFVSIISIISEFIAIIAIIIFAAIFFALAKKGKSSNQHNKSGYDRRKTIGRITSSSRFQAHAYNDKTVSWCANLLKTDKDVLKNILDFIPGQYIHFYLYKRSGGYRMINAPKSQLLAIQQTIYRNILSSVNIHPGATGFRKNMSIVDNASKHLGNEYVFKTDIKDFFGAIKRRRVKKVFLSIGYPNEIAALLSDLCCLNRRLPQGSPASPILSNIVAYEMDVKLSALAKEYGMTYSRYADDVAFSGKQPVAEKEFLLRVAQIMVEEKFELNMQKTRFWNKHHRKILTGISISGERLTIPKKKKREMRKNIHYILTKGLNEHKKHIGSTDPAYLKRLTGYLNFWLTVEPDNKFAKKSLIALNRIRE